MFILDAGAAGGGTTTKTDGAAAGGGESKTTETKAMPGTPKPDTKPAEGTKPAASPAAPDEVTKLRNELAETQRKAEEEVKKAYNLGLSHRETFTPSDGQPNNTTKPAAETAPADDEDPLGIFPILEKWDQKKKTKETQTQQTTNILNKSIEWVKENVEFYNPNADVAALSTHVVNEAYKDFAMNPKVSFIDHLQKHLTIHGRQKVTTKEVKSPVTDKAVSTSQSDYGGQAGSQMNPADELTKKETELATLREKVRATGGTNDALINQVGVLSFEVQRLRQKIRGA